MRVAADHLFRDRLHHAAEVERALFLGHARMENDLQQQVAEFVAQVDQVVARDRVGDLISLLQRIGCDRLEILLQIPGAARYRRAQRGHDLQQAGNVAGWLHAANLVAAEAKPKGMAQIVHNTDTTGCLTRRRNLTK